MKDREHWHKNSWRRIYFFFRKKEIYYLIGDVDEGSKFR
jgi:hypothetical protein